LFGIVGGLLLAGREALSFISREGIEEKRFSGYTVSMHSVDVSEHGAPIALGNACLMPVS
jgi:hypothetical protein